MENKKNKTYQNAADAAPDQDFNVEQGENGAGIDDVAPDAETVEEAESVEEVNILESKVSELEDQVAKEKKEYMFLMAEFDNFRKRTLREKSEIIKNAGENVLKGLLPIMDDFERGIKAADSSDDSASIKEGMAVSYTSDAADE